MKKRRFLLYLLLLCPLLMLGQSRLTSTPGDFRVNNGVKIGNSSWATPGLIRYHTNTWWGYNGTTWLDLGAETTQELSIEDDTLSLSNGGGSVVLPASSGTGTDYSSSLGFVVTETILNEGGTIIGSGGSDSTKYALPVVTGGTVYIDPTNLQAGDGTIGNPFSSWASIVEQPNYNYLIKRGTTLTLTTQINVGVGPVVIGCYGSDTTVVRPTIDAQFTGYSIYFDNGYGMIRDIIIVRPNYTSNAIRLENCLGDMYLYNVDVFGGGQSIVAVGDAGAYANNWPASSDLKILYTDIDGSWEDNVYISSVMSVEVAHCTFLNANQSYTPLNTGALGDCMQIQGEKVEFNIYRNTFTRNPAKGNKFCLLTSGVRPDYPNWAQGGWYLRGNVYDNIFDGNNAPAVSGYYCDPTPSPNVVNVYRNIFKNCTNVGLKSYAKTTNASYNLFYNCGSAGSSTGYLAWLLTEPNYGPPVMNSYNNVYYANGTGSATDASSSLVNTRNNVYMSNGYAMGGGASAFNSNYDYFHTGQLIMSSHTTLAAFQGQGDEANGVVGNTLMANPSAYDFRPLALSPLLNTGIDLGLTRDISYDLVDDPPSRGAYENVDPPNGEIIVIPPTIRYDSVLVSKAHIIGDYASGDYLAIDTTGTLTLHGNATLDVDFQRIPLAAGVDNQIQYGLVGLLNGDPGFNYFPDSNTMHVDSMRTAKVKFRDGSELSSASGLGALPSGVTYQTQFSMINGSTLPTGVAPDILYIETDTITSNSSIPIEIPSGYSPLEAYWFSYTPITSLNLITNGSNNLISSIATGGKYRQPIASLGDYRQFDTCTMIAIGNESPGYKAIIKLTKTPFYAEAEPIPAIPPYLDGNTSAWYAGDTATYYDLATADVLRLYDKTGRKALGAQLMASLDFQSGWTSINATATSSNTFTCTAAGGFYRNYSLNTRGVYRFTSSATIPGGALRAHWTTVSPGTPNQIVQLTAGAQNTVYTSFGDYIYYRMSIAQATNTAINSFGLQRYTGNHLVQGTVANSPDFAAGIISFNGTTDYLISAITPTLTAAKIFIVGQKGTGGYFLYESLTGFGEIVGGVLTLGSNNTLSSFYDIDIKEIVIRDETNTANDAAFRAQLKLKYSVTSGL